MSFRLHILYSSLLGRIMSPHCLGWFEQYGEMFQIILSEMRRNWSTLSAHGCTCCTRVPGKQSASPPRRRNQLWTPHVSAFQIPALISRRDKEISSLSVAAPAPGAAVCPSLAPSPHSGSHRREKLFWLLNGRMTDVMKSRNKWCPLDILPH